MLCCRQKGDGPSRVPFECNKKTTNLKCLKSTPLLACGEEGKMGDVVSNGICQEHETKKKAYRASLSMHRGSRKAGRKVVSYTSGESKKPNGCCRLPR